MNWGTKLVIGMAIFMAFILSLSYKMIFSNSDALIEKDYYEQGLNYNEKYDAKQRAVADSVIPEVNMDQTGVTFSFRLPTDCKFHFKRLSDSKMDKVIERSTDQDLKIAVSNSELKKGPWRLSAYYAMNGKNYAFEKEIIMP